MAMFPRGNITMRPSGKLPRWARSFPCMRCLLTAFGSPDDEELGKLRKRAPPN